MKSKSLRLSLLILLGWMMPGSAVADCSVSASASASSSCEENNPCAQGRNTWLPRSFGSYSMHDIQQLQTVCEEKDHKVNFTFITEFMQNFGTKCSKGCKNLGSAPFWSGSTAVTGSADAVSSNASGYGDNTLTIGNNDGRAQLDAYQLGMGNIVVDPETGIGGVIQLNPRVQHAGTEMMMLYQQKKDERGLYFKVQAPLGAMTIDPRLTELVVATPDNDPYFHQTTAGASEIDFTFNEYPAPLSRPQSVSEAFYGSTADASPNGNLNKPIRIRAGRISPCKQSAIRLGDLSTSLGYNVYVNEEKGFVGLGFKASMPTGNVPTGDYMLEPIFGRAGAWALGGEVSAAYKVWENEECNRYLKIYAQGEVLHLLHGRRPNFRSFDLKLNGKGSKYLLVQHYLPTYNFSGPYPTAGVIEPILDPRRVQPAVNLTTMPVLSKIAVEGSFALLLDFNCNNWNVAIGGEFWGRSHEKLAIDICHHADRRHESMNDYAVLGRQVSSYAINNPGAVAGPVFLDTFLCEPAAKINQSQDPVILDGALTNPATAPLITGANSNPGAIVNPAVLPAGIADARLSENRIPADLSEALDIAGAAAGRVFTGKINGEVGYTWRECEHMPTVMVMGGAEFTNRTNGAVQLWSVGLQGSLNF